MSSPASPPASAPKRPRPRLDADNRAFWTGGEQGQLNIMQCGDCHAFTHPPRMMCRHCQSENMAPTAVAGTGEIDTFTINHQAWMPGLDVPYIIARVRLDGVPGVVLTTNIVNCPADDIDFDDKVRVKFIAENGIHYPVFEKAA